MRVVSLVLVFIIISSIPLSASASEMNNSTDAGEILLVNDNVIITSHENDKGDTILCEYTDGILTQRNTVPSDQEGVVIREFLDVSGQNVAIEDSISADDVGLTKCSISASTYVTSGYTAFGGAAFYDATYAYTSWYVNRWIGASGNPYI